jgi:hypothetical protein
MTREAFAARLEQLHPLAVADPDAYRWRVRGWALLGYGFILLPVAKSACLDDATTAAEAWFGCHLPGLAAELDHIWATGTRRILHRAAGKKHRLARRARAAPARNARLSCHAGLKTRPAGLNR